MSQLSMFPPAVEAMTVQLRRGELGGWTMRVAARLDGERWTDVDWQEYDSLSMSEVLEVLDAVASQIGPMIS